MVIAIDISSPPDESLPNSALAITYKALCISYYELARIQSKTIMTQTIEDTKSFLKPVWTANELKKQF
jgi:hypothetical protein